MKKIINKGFTLVELMVVIAIIGILSAIVYANFEDAREQARDKTRMTALKEMQVALELYRAQNGEYPDQGCGGGGTFAGPGSASASGLASCPNYIIGLTPDFISVLPTDPNSENEDNKGFYYRTNADGTAYKLMILDSVETLTVSSYDHEFARCPKVQTTGPCTGGVPANTYAIYSRGAEDW